MTRLQTLVVAAVLVAPAAAVARPYVYTDDPYYTQRITVYDEPRYLAFVAREGGALHSGGATLDDTLLAESIARALARDPVLAHATVTVSANYGRVALSGMGNGVQSAHAQQIAKRIAGNVTGELNDGG